MCVCVCVVRTVKFSQFQNVKYTVINYGPHAVQQITESYSSSITEFLTYDSDCNWPENQRILKEKLFIQEYTASY